MDRAPLAQVRDSRWARFVCHSTRRERRMGLAPLLKTSLWCQFAHWFSPVHSVESGDPSRKMACRHRAGSRQTLETRLCPSSKSLFFFRTMINSGRCKIWSWLERWHLDGLLHNLRHRNIHRPFHSLSEPRAGGTSFATSMSSSVNSGMSTHLVDDLQARHLQGDSELFKKKKHLALHHDDHVDKSVQELHLCLLVLMLVSRPGCQLKTLLFHLFPGREMILRAIRHFCLLCVSIQQVIFCFSMYSSASLVLLLMYSIQSFSFSVASISSSASSWKDTSLSWSLFEFCSEPSSIS